MVCRCMVHVVSYVVTNILEQPPFSFYHDNECEAYSSTSLNHLLNCTALYNSKHKNIILKFCIFGVFVIQCWLTTSKMHLSHKCRYLLCYVTHTPTCFGCTWIIIREITVSREVKHPISILAYEFISVVYIVHHLGCKLLRYSIQAGQVKCSIVLNICVYS